MPHDMIDSSGPLVRHLPTSTFVRDKWILMSNKLIFKLLVRMDKLKFYRKISVFIFNNKLYFHPDKLNLGLLVQMDKITEILSLKPCTNLQKNGLSDCRCVQ